MTDKEIEEYNKEIYKSVSKEMTVYMRVMHDLNVVIDESNRIKFNEMMIKYAKATNNYIDELENQIKRDRGR